MESYRTSHSSTGHGRHYDELLFAPGAYDAAVWHLEQQILAEIAQKYFSSSPQKILDFACGTGRITEFLSAHGWAAVGVDVSEEMLAEARRKLPHVQFICGDITMEPDLLTGFAPFDCATAFRFFLNAEPELRSAALRALHGALKPGGLLICNNHGNITSLWRLVRLFRRLLGMEVQPRTLACAHFLDLLKTHGFQPLEIRGVCFLPRGLFRVIPETWWRAAECMLARLRILDRWAIYQIYVARRMP